MEQLGAYYSASDVAAMVSQYTELPWILLMLAMFAAGTRSARSSARSS